MPSLADKVKRKKFTRKKFTAQKISQKISAKNLTFTSEKISCISVNHRFKPAENDLTNGSIAMMNSETPHSYDLDFKIKYLDFLMYYFKLDKDEWQAYQAYKQAKQESEVVDMIGTFLKEEGWKEGKSAGKVEEGRDLLLMLFPQKLGSMPPEISEAIRGLDDVNRIHSIAGRFMEINDWQELKRYLN